MPARKFTKYFVLHVSAIRPSSSSSATTIDSWHKNRGWNGIGYHYVIRRDGTVETGRAEKLIGAHVAGHNSHSIGICFEGGLDENGKPADTRTDAQKKAAITLIKKLLKTYPNATVVGHRDLSPDRDGDGIIEPHEHLKACPCFDAIPWANSVDLPGADIRGTWLTTGPDHSVVEQQRLLKEAGYEFGPIDGIIGRKTKAAITRFQKAAGLTVTSRFDAATMARLEAMAAERRAPMAKTISDLMHDKGNLQREIYDLDSEPEGGLLLSLLTWLLSLLKKD